DTAELWNGTTWTLNAPTRSVRAAPAFAAVACLAGNACTAVGTDDIASAPGSFDFSYPNGPPLAAEFRAGLWGAQPAIDPTGPDDSTLNGISCPAARVCVAVGSNRSPATLQDTALIERWDGRSWTVEPLPLPQGVFASKLTA